MNEHKGYIDYSDKKIRSLIKENTELNKKAAHLEYRVTKQEILLDYWRGKAISSEPQPVFS